MLSKERSWMEVSHFLSRLSSASATSQQFFAKIRHSPDIRHDLKFEENCE